jgi:hypothetical protein
MDAARQQLRLQIEEVGLLQIRTSSFSPKIKTLMVVNKTMFDYNHETQKQ